VDTVDECAQRIGDVLRDPALSKDLGRRGKEYVRAHFLMPRLLRDYLRVLLQMSG
jgi:trehalose synthase